MIDDIQRYILELDINNYSNPGKISPKIFQKKII